MHRHGRIKNKIKKCIGICFVMLFLPQAQMVALAVDSDSKQLKAEEAWLLSVPVSAPGILEVKNQGIDTEAVAIDQSGVEITRSATWRGREGRYFLHIPPNASKVKITSFEPFSSSGKVTINWLMLDDTDGSGITRAYALAHYAVGMNYRMTAYSSGNSDDNVKAVEAYQQSLDQLGQTRLLQDADKRLIADIHYEMGVAYRHMGLWDKARQSQELAKAGFAGLADYKGVASAAVELGVLARAAGDKALALQYYNDALAFRIENADHFFAAFVLNNIGVVEWASENYPAAVDAYSDALVFYTDGSLGSVSDVLQLSVEDFLAKGNLNEVISTLYNLALVTMSAGGADASLDLWRKTLGLSEAAGQSRRSAQVRFGLGSALIDQGQLELGLQNINAALDTFFTRDDRLWISRASVAVGDVYANIGEHDRALGYYQQSLDFADGHQRQSAYAITQMGMANWALGNERLALDQLAEAQASFESSSQPGSMAVVISKKSMLNYELGYEQQALTSQFEAIRIFETINHPKELARAQSRYGQLLLANGQELEARQVLQQALQGHRSVNDELFELDTLTALSKAYTGTAAIDVAKSATQLADRIRSEITSPGVQASFLASRRNAFERYIDLLVDAGDIESAWAVSEQIKARNLLDLIQQGHGTEGLVDNFDTLRAQRNVLLAKLDAVSKTNDNSELNNLRREIDLLNGQLQSAQSIQDRNLLAGLQAPLVPAVIQSQLSDDAAILSYFIGQHHSHLWVVKNGGITHHQISGADQINTIANELSRSLRSHRQSLSRITYMADQLSKMVLQPAVDEIQGYDLAVIADGGLQLVPFGLLSMGAASNNHDSFMLVDNSTVTYSPSTKIFNLLSEPAPIVSPASNIMVLADPLASTPDSNALITSGDQINNAYSVSNLDFSHLMAQRSLRQSTVNIAALPGTRLEAAAIKQTVRDLAGKENSNQLKVLTGIEANQTFVESGGLSGYDIVHFATHGVVDADLPELSGLVLAQDAQHSEVSYLRPHQIAALRLDAELVVLSGCETGIGKSIGSEGSLSLSRPFLVAGARQVISSLWQVSDRATAVLMERFYYHLLKENQSSELALRSAQSWMREQPEWAHPYYWAGFVVQGGRTVLQAPTADAQQLLMTASEQF